jgi:preprotein translocase subunit SecA
MDPEKIGEGDVFEDGGLHIIGSERHESRRIDRQLRGRAGRQGDPGATQFFLSLEDDLMRLFNSDRVAGIMERLGAQEGEVITHALVTRSIGSAQKRVEMQNFEARKRLLEYDDVMNQQREVIYDLRLFALEGGEDLKGELWEMMQTAVRDVTDEYAADGAHPEEWDLAGLRGRLMLDQMVVVDGLPRENTPDPMVDDRDELEQMVLDAVREGFRRKLKSFGEHEERILSWILLGIIDGKWRDHLYDLDHLKASIGFRGWGQKDPLIEYKQEAYSMFVDLMRDIRKSVATLTFRAQIAAPQPRPVLPRRLVLSGPSDTPDGRPSTVPAPVSQHVEAPPADPLAAAMAGSRRVSNPAPAPTPAVSGLPSAGLAMDVRRLRTNRGENGAAESKPVTADDKIGRNDPCPCGSGKKYKKCHGAGVV